MFVTEVNMESWPSDCLFVPLKQVFERRMFLNTLESDTLFPALKRRWMGGRALEQSAQGDPAVSLSREIQKPPEQVPVWPARGDPALARGVD